MQHAKEKRQAELFGVVGGMEGDFSSASMMQLMSPEVGDSACSRSLHATLVSQQQSLLQTVLLHPVKIEVRFRLLLLVLAAIAAVAPLHSTAQAPCKQPLSRLIN